MRKKNMLKHLSLKIILSTAVSYLKLRNFNRKTDKLRQIAHFFTQFDLTVVLLSNLKYFKFDEGNLRMVL